MLFCVPVLFSRELIMHWPTLRTLVEYFSYPRVERKGVCSWVCSGLYAVILGSAPLELGWIIQHCLLKIMLWYFMVIWNLWPTDLVPNAWSKLSQQFVMLRKVCDFCQNQQEKYDSLICLIISFTLKYSTTLSSLKFSLLLVYALYAKFVFRENKPWLWTWTDLMVRIFFIYILIS